MSTTACNSRVSKTQEKTCLAQVLMTVWIPQCHQSSSSKNEQEDLTGARSWTLTLTRSHNRSTWDNSKASFRTSPTLTLIKKTWKGSETITSSSCSSSRRWALNIWYTRRTTWNVSQGHLIFSTRTQSNQRKVFATKFKNITQRLQTWRKKTKWSRKRWPLTSIW